MVVEFATGGDASFHITTVAKSFTHSWHRHLVA